MKKLQIVSMYKHNIVYKNVKKKQLKLFVYSLIICCVSVFMFTYLYQVNDVIKNSTSVFNPISELYRDVEVASFVNQGNVNFIVPIKTDNYQINLNNISFKVTSSIMIYSPANGIVESINNVNEKTIVIKHSDSLFSIIKNINIVGVKVGDVVSQGKEIATAKPGDDIIFMIESDGEYVEGLYLNKSFVKWQTK